MPRNRLIPGLVLVAALAGLGAGYAVLRLQPPSFHGTYLGESAPSDFTLLGARRGAVNLADFRGQAVLLFFGYTSCPDICPLTMAKLAGVMDELGDRRSRVQVLLISVDPAVDTPERLDAYATGFDPAFIGLGGSPAELAAVARAFGAFAGEVEEDAAPATGHEGHDARAGTAPARVIPHTSHVFGLDRAGRFRVLWGPDLGAAEIAADVRALLRL